MEDIKIVLSLTDNYISIIAFKKNNNSMLLLYEEKNDIDRNLIKKGYILEVEKVTQIIKHILSKASNFIGYHIKNIYVSIDVENIKIKSFELANVKIPNGILDQFIWENNILKNVNINQEANEYIFDIDILEWLINNKTHYSLDTQYQVNQIDIKGKMYLMNKVLYHQYVEMFQKCEINIIKCYPMVINLKYIVNSERINNYEMFVNLNNSSLSLSVFKGNHLINNVFDNELSLSALTKEIIKNTKMTEEQVWQYFKYVPELLNCQSDLNIVSEFSQKYLQLKAITVKDINHIIFNYIKKVGEFIQKNIDFLDKEKKVKISNLSLFPSNAFTEKIFNLMKVYLINDNNIIEFKETRDISLEHNFSTLFAKRILSENNLTPCVSNLTIKNNKRKNNESRW